MYNDIPGPELIRVFLGQLLEDAGIKPVPELKESMISDLEDRFSTHMMQVLAKGLTQQDFEEFIGKSETDPVAGQLFLSSKINNLPEFYKNAMAEFRQMFLNK